MKRIAFPCLCLLLLAVTSCQRDTAVRSALARAEAVMESDPSAARLILDSLSHEIVNHPNRQSIVNRQSSNRQSDLALYALLRTQADYKCRVRLTSDSLPLIATRYYGTTHKTQRAALAQYYLGCAYSDMGRDLDAIDALLRAVTLFPDTTNKYYAYSQRDVGRLMLNHDQEAKALEAFKHYRWSDICRTDSFNIGCADRYMGLAYLYLQQTEQAEKYFLKVLNNPSMNKKHYDFANFQLAKLYAFLEDDYSKAQPYVEQYIQGYRNKEKIGAAYFLKGEICFHKNELDSAFFYYNKVLGCEEEIHTYCETYKRLIEVAQALGKNDSTDVWFRHYVALADSVSKIRRDKEISDIENNHVVELHDRALAAHRSRLHWTWGILFTLLVLLSGLFVLLNDRKRRKRYKQAVEELQQASVEVLLAQLGETPIDIAIYRKKLAACQKLFQQKPTARLLMLPPASLTDEQKRALMNDLTRSFVDIMIDIKNASDAINDEELKYCILSFLKCSTAQMAELLNNTDGTLRKRKKRIKEKMPESLHSLFFS